MPDKAHDCHRLLGGLNAIEGAKRTCDDGVRHVLVGGIRRIQNGFSFMVSQSPKGLNSVRQRALRIQVCVAEAKPQVTDGIGPFQETSDRAAET